MNDTRQMTDPRPQLQTEMTRAAATIRSLTPEQFGSPSQCPGWDTRDVVTHLVGVADRIGCLARGEVAVGEVTCPELHDDELADAFDEATTNALGEWGDDARLGQIVSPPFGQMPGAVALAVYTTEVIIHHWDILDASGTTSNWDDGVLEACLAGAMASLPAEGRDEIPFGDVVEVPADAPSIDRLVAYFGRRP